MPNKPNILLITTDQQRFDTIAAHGNDHIYTPHLDWLADTGITYTRAYCDSPLCMPSRVTIMTGLHAHTHGLTNIKNSPTPMLDNPTLPGLLTQGGYQTRAQGKMHFHPVRANYGFEHMELPLDYYRERLHLSPGSASLPKQHGVGENETVPVISTVHENESITYWTVKRSIDFLETRDETRPFFLWTSFTKPHPPFDPPYNYWSLYANKDLPAPVRGDWSETPEDVPQGFMRPTYLLNNTHRQSIEKQIDTKRAYYACISQIDYQLGLLFGRMNELGILDNTWIIFTSDHGDMMGDHHMGCKHTYFEGSAHVPMLIRPPAPHWVNNPADTPAGTKVDTLVSLADIMPTILKQADIEAPDNLDGTDMLDFVETPDSSRTIYGQCMESLFAVTESRYKYTWTPEGDGELLFDIENDPMEQTNLAASPEHTELLTSMRNKLITHLEQRNSPAVKDGKLVPKPSISGTRDTPNLPGMISIGFNCDVLH